MERIEPTFVPEWYKGSNSSVISSGNLNHQSGSSLQLDENNVEFSSRSRLAVGSCDYDASRSFPFPERTSSFRRSASSNDHTARVKDGFCRSFRDWDRGPEKDVKIHRERISFPENGFGNKFEKESSRRSQSFLSGKKSDSLLKRIVHDSSNDVQSVSSRISGIGMSSFEREFPSLVAEEKHVGPDLPRVSSPGLSTALHNLPAAASTAIGGEGWTSALAEVPPVVVESSLIISSFVQPSPTLTTSTPASLNMAETVAQSPARTFTAAQFPSDSKKIEELHRQQILKLRPMTPSTTKNLGLNLAEKSKIKGTKLPEYSSLKLGQHSSSQLVNHTFRSNIRLDVPKTSQPGSFQVLNREKNAASPTDKDDSRPINGNRAAATSSGILSSASPLLKDQFNPKFLNVDGRTGALITNSYGEKKLPQSQNRNDFFNSLRKKTLSSSQENLNQESRCNVSAPILENLDDASEKMKDAASLSSISQSLVENLNSSETCEFVEKSEQSVPDEEEEAFLRSLGWQENDMEEALTPEEIESFISEYEKRLPASKLKIAGV